MKVDKPRNTKLIPHDENIIEALKLCTSNSKRLRDRGKVLLENLLGKRVAKQVLKGDLRLINETHKIFRTTGRDNDSGGLSHKE